MRKWISRLQKYGNRWWYAPMVGLLAFADHFVVVIPTDGLLITSTIMSPRRWIYNASVTTLGSSIGALLLAWLVREYGHELVVGLFPTLHETMAWRWTERLMLDWGTIALFLVSLSPFMQHPAVILAGMAATPLGTLFGAVFLGRVLKYLLLSWVASHAPQLLNKIWGIQNELSEVTEKKENSDRRDGSGRL